MNATIKRYGTVLRCYDNGGRSLDRYTIIPPRYARQYRERAPGAFLAITSSEIPSNPLGFGQVVPAVPGAHLGRRIHWNDLPLAVQRFARDVFPEYTPDDGLRYYL